MKKAKIRAERFYTLIGGCTKAMQDCCKYICNKMLRRKLFNALMILSIIATPHLVIQAYARRGYFAIGGEWLVTVAILLGYAVVLSVGEMWKEVK